MNTNVNLVQTTTSDDLILSGLYSEGSKEREAIIFIHGFQGNFFNHQFIHDLGDSLNKNNNGFILAETRGTGLFTDFIKRGREDSINIGSYYEKLEDAHLDISAWIEFLQSQGYTKLTLVGHSLGTIKVTRYLFEGKYKNLIKKLILLAPFDKNGYVENKTKGEWHNHLKIAEQKIKEGKGLEIITDEFDDFPMTFQNYYSWYREEEINKIWDFYRPDYISPVLTQINIPVQVVIGEEDEGFYTSGIGGTFEKSCQYLRNSIKNLDLQIIKGAGHTYLEHEDELAESVISFLNVV